MPLYFHLVLDAMNRSLLTPATFYLKQDNLVITTSDGFRPTINGNTIQQTSETQTLPFTPGVDTGTIATMSVRGGAAAAPFAIQVQAARFLTASNGTGTAAIANSHVLVAFPELRVVTDTGSPTQVFIGGATPVVPASMRPTFIKGKTINMIDNNLPVLGQLWMTTGGLLFMTLPGGTAFTPPYGADGDQQIEYLLT